MLIWQFQFDVYACSGGYGEHRSAVGNVSKRNVCGNNHPKRFYLCDGNNHNLRKELLFHFFAFGLSFHRADLHFGHWQTSLILGTHVHPHRLHVKTSILISIL
jgi:hypothetical protein